MKGSRQGCGSAGASPSRYCVLPESQCHWVAAQVVFCTKGALYLLTLLAVIYQSLWSHNTARVVEDSGLDTHASNWRT
jgi:hypothetical protein